MDKLNRVLLVDDYDADNFLHEMLFEELDCTHEVATALNGQEALDYLTSAVDGAYPKPELICLDINMPVMNGWEFLRAYEKLDEKFRGGVVLMMVTTSLNPDDKSAADGCPVINDYISKPLTHERLIELLDQHFPGRFDFG